MSGNNQKGPYNDKAPPDLLLTNSTSHDNYSANNSEKRASDESFADGNGAIVLLTACLVLVGLVQAGVYVWQAIIMRRTLVHSIKSNQSAQRPYVWTNIEGMDRFNESIPPSFSFRLIHSGQSPAKDVEFRARIFVSSTDGKELPEIDAPWIPRLGNIFPNDVSPRVVRFVNHQQSFSKEDIRRVQSKTHFIGIGLEIQYWDSLGEGHRTKAYYAIAADTESLIHLTSYEPGHCELQFVQLPGGSSFT